MTYEYKTVGAPEKGKRKRGARTPSDRVAVAFDMVLQDEAVDGWEYLRTDLLPVIERSGWFGRGHEVQRAVMVFRRLLSSGHSAETAAEPLEKPAALRPAPSVMPEPTVSDDPDLWIADTVRGPGNRRADG